MSDFKPNKQTDIIADASHVETGAMLTQESKVICKASRALSEVEQCYSQIEREMPAVVLCCWDAQPAGPLNVRSLQLIIALSHVGFDLDHKAGKDQIVDRNRWISLVQTKWGHKS